MTLQEKIAFITYKKNRTWLISKLGITRPTFVKKEKDYFLFTLKQVEIINEIYKHLKNEV